LINYYCIHHAHTIKVLYMNARTTVNYITLSVNEEVQHFFFALFRIASVG